MGLFFCGTYAVVIIFGRSCPFFGGSNRKDFESVVVGLIFAFSIRTHAVFCAGRGVCQNHCRILQIQCCDFWTLGDWIFSQITAQDLYGPKQIGCVSTQIIELPLGMTVLSFGWKKLVVLHIYSFCEGYKSFIDVCHRFHNSQVLLSYLKIAAEQKRCLIEIIFVLELVDQCLKLDFLKFKTKFCVIKLLAFDPEQIHDLPGGVYHRVQPSVENDSLNSCVPVASLFSFFIIPLPNFPLIFLGSLPRVTLVFLCSFPSNVRNDRGNKNGAKSENISPTWRCVGETYVATDYKNAHRDESCRGQCKDTEKCDPNDILKFKHNNRPKTSKTTTLSCGRGASMSLAVAA